MRRFLAMIAALLALTASCTSADDTAADQSPDTATSPVTETSQDPTPTAIAPEPASTSELTLGLPDIEAAQAIAPAALGTYVVAREAAGIKRDVAAGQTARFEIPVYDTPFGPPRVLLDNNEIDGVRRPVTLTNWPDDEGVLVMRVVAGGPGDDWLMVQAPARPNNSYVWVRRSDFDFGFTTMRIEIDLADGGGLTVFDGSTELLKTKIVHGRDSRPTPAHVTYIERGIRGNSLSPAYGTAILSMASFSEVLSTFGGGVPNNFLHGTNQPELMGQRVSSGEIRIPDETLDKLIETIVPGTPVLLFNSSVDGQDKDAILRQAVTPAMTVGFLIRGPGVVDGTALVTPQLWRRCPGASPPQLLCRMRLEESTEGRYAYLTARTDAGEFNEEVGAQVIPVYDVPGGEPRVLVHTAADLSQLRFPLRNPTALGQPLVLSPLEVSPDQQWIRVHAPVRPHRQSVWVRAEDFEFGWTDYRIEIDIAGEGDLTLFDGDTALISNLIVSGRESRPTPLGASYVEEVIVGNELSPAYGSYVITVALYNEVLSTFNGGRLARQLIHGTNQPELMGQRVASGHIRIPNEVLTFIAELPGGLVGAPVITVDSTGGDRASAIAAEESRPWTPAETTNEDDIGLQIANPGY